MAVLLAAGFFAWQSLSAKGPAQDGAAGLEQSQSTTEDQSDLAPADLQAGAERDLTPTLLPTTEATGERSHLTGDGRVVRVQVQLPRHAGDAAFEPGLMAYVLPKAVAGSTAARGPLRTLRAGT